MISYRCGECERETQGACLVCNECLEADIRMRIQAETAGLAWPRRLLGLLLCLLKAPSPVWHMDKQGEPNLVCGRRRIALTHVRLASRLWRHVDCLDCWSDRPVQSEYMAQSMASELRFKYGGSRVGWLDCRTGGQASKDQISEELQLRLDMNNRRELARLEGRKRVDSPRAGSP